MSEIVSVQSKEPWPLTLLKAGSSGDLNNHPKCLSSGFSGLVLGELETFLAFDFDVPIPCGMHHRETNDIFEAFEVIQHEATTGPRACIKKFTRFSNYYFLTFQWIKSRSLSWKWDWIQILSYLTQILWPRNVEIKCVVVLFNWKFNSSPHF